MVLAYEAIAGIGGFFGAELKMLSGVCRGGQGLVAVFWPEGNGECWL